MRMLRRVARDLRDRRHVDAYVVAAAAVVLAALSLFGDLVGDDVRWAVVLASLALLVYRITLSELDADAMVALQDRTSFEGTSFGSRIREAHQVWIFGPSAANLLTEQVADDLRKTVLQRPDGVVRVVVLDPGADEAVAIAARQLDHSIDYPVQDLRTALGSTVHRLEAMRRWTVAGTVDYRLAAYNPGFSLVAIDPQARHGKVIVEFHGFHNESTANRMHVELDRADNDQWFAYWTDQFLHLWSTATPPDQP